jgi:hypothetical protein
MSRPALGPTQPPIQWVPGALSLGVKRAGREADHSPPSSAKVCVELYLHSSNTPSWSGAKLKNTGTCLPLLYLLTNKPEKPPMVPHPYGRKAQAHCTLSFLFASYGLHNTKIQIKIYFNIQHIEFPSSANTAKISTMGRP